MKWATTVYEVVVAFFQKYFKSRIFAFAGGSPPCTPRRSAGGRPIGQEIMQNLYGWYETEPKSVVFGNLLFFEKKNCDLLFFEIGCFFKFVYFSNLLLWNAFFLKFVNLKGCSALLSANVAILLDFF